MRIGKIVKNLVLATGIVAGGATLSGCSTGFCDKYIEKTKNEISNSRILTEDEYRAVCDSSRNHDFTATSQLNFWKNELAEVKYRKGLRNGLKQGFGKGLEVGKKFILDSIANAAKSDSIANAVKLDSIANAAGKLVKKVTR